MNFLRGEFRPIHYRFRKIDFKLGVQGEGQDTSRHFEGSFGFIRAIPNTADVRPRSKNQNLN